MGFSHRSSRVTNSTKMSPAPYVPSVTTGICIMAAEGRDTVTQHIIYVTDVVGQLGYVRVRCVAMRHTKVIL